MSTVTNQTEYEAAVAANDAEIIINGTVNTLTVPTHACKIVISAGTSLTGVIVNFCDAGTAYLYYGSFGSDFPS